MSLRVLLCVTLLSSLFSPPSLQSTGSTSTQQCHHNAEEQSKKQLHGIKVLNNRRQRKKFQPSEHRDTAEQLEQVTLINRLTEERKKFSVALTLVDVEGWNIQRS